jgi:hypothetical protein
MKRDMDLIRDLLLRIEAAPGLSPEECFRPSHLYEEMPDRNSEEIFYHLMLLLDAGFIIGDPLAELDFAVERMTWQGHELLETVRPPPHG